MLDKINTGPIFLDPENKALFKTEEIIGEIYAVQVEFNNKGATDTILKVFTSIGEEIMTLQGIQEQLFYPRNWDVQNQMQGNTNVVSNEGGALNAEKYISIGPLTIDVQGSIPEDYITNVLIIYRAETLKEKIEDINLQKDTGMVSTGTPGVYNPRHSARRDIKAYIQKISSKIFMDERKFIKNAENNIIKAQSDITSFVDYVEKDLFARSFDGVNLRTSDLIKSYIMRSMLKGKTKDQVMAYLTKKGIPPYQAMNIYRTETQAIYNKAREWSYKRIDPDDELKYKWLGPNDHRTTKICGNITQRTEKGVSMDQLKEIIDDEVELAKERDELPADFDNRDYTPHFMCRHTFVRKY